MLPEHVKQKIHGVAKSSQDKAYEHSQEMGDRMTSMLYDLELGNFEFYREVLRVIWDDGYSAGWSDAWTEVDGLPGVDRPNPYVEESDAGE